MSYYALFKGWLLLSQPPGCLNTPTSFATERALEDLSCGSGLFPSRRRNSSPAVRLPRLTVQAFRVWLGLVTLRPLAHPVLYLPHVCRDASPKAISGRTSYLQVRLAYHPYPQLIPQLCNVERFGPPRRVSFASAWPWVAHLVSCLIPATRRPLQTRFRSGSECPSLNLATEMNSLAHSPKGTPSATYGPLTACKRTVSGSISLPSPGFFSPFPHGTGPLSVAKCI